MTKTELVYEVANRTGLKKGEVEKILTAFTDTVAEQVKRGEKVSITGFGTFEAGLRSARTGRNPHTGEEIEISASKTVKFKPGKGLKDRVK